MRSFGFVEIAHSPKVTFPIVSMLWFYASLRCSLCRPRIQPLQALSRLFDFHLTLSSTKRRLKVTSHAFLGSLRVTKGQKVEPRLELKAFFCGTTAWYMV